MNNYDPTSEIDKIVVKKNYNNIYNAIESMIC